MTRGRAVRVAALVSGVILMTVLVARLGPQRILDQLATAGPEAFWLLVVYAAGTTIGAISWYVLLPAPTRPSFRAAVASRFAASGANTMVPLFGFGGEPVRLLWMRPEDRAAGVAAIVIDRLLYALASALFLLVGAIVTVRLTAMPSAYAISGVLGAAALFVVTVVAIWLTARHRMADRIHRLIRRLRRRAAPLAGSTFGEDVDRSLEQILERRRHLVLALLAQLLARVVLGLEIYVAFRALGLALPLELALAFAVIPVLLAFVGAIVPSQIGLQEGAQALVASAFGIAAPIAVAAVLLTRSRQVVTAALAWLLIASIRQPKR